jgi:hypothetical protein
MPKAAPRSCRCGAVVPAGQPCSRCSKDYDAKRGSARQRGYDGAWEAFRADFLKLNPKCCIAHCAAPATDVDHIVSLRQGGARLDPRNCRPMCHAHHSQRTMRDQVPHHHGGWR